MKSMKRRIFSLTVLFLLMLGITAHIVLLYNEAYDRFERLVSFSNFDSEYYRNIIINSKTCTFSSSNQKATIVVNYTAQDKKTNVVEKGNATFVVTIWD